MVRFPQDTENSMVRAKGILLASLIFGVAGWTAPAAALESYSDTQTQQFMDWCTGAKSASESTCSCTVKSLARSLPATALSAFINKQTSGTTGFSLSTAAVSTGAMITNAMLSCTK